MTEARRGSRPGELSKSFTRTLVDDYAARNFTVSHREVPGRFRVPARAAVRRRQGDDHAAFPRCDREADRPSCGVALPASVTPTTYARRMTDESPDQHVESVVATSHPDRGEAEVTEAHLAANDIEAIIVDEVEGGMLPVEEESSVTVLLSARRTPSPHKQVLGN